MALDVGVQYANYRGVNNPYHYAMTHNWALVIDNVPDPLQNLATGLLNRTGAINCSCIQVNGLPNSNLSEGIVSGNIRGVPFHQAAGRESSVREISFSLYEVQDYALLRFFECWKSLAVNRFDWTQNLSAMVPQGVKVIMSDTDRQTPRLVYDLYDVVCTKCSLSDQMGSEPELVKTGVSLKCGYYNISNYDRGGSAGIALDAPTNMVL